MNPATWGVGEWLGVLGAIFAALSTFAGGVAWCVTANMKLNKINGRVGRHDEALGKHTRRIDRLEINLGLTEELS